MGNSDYAARRFHSRNGYDHIHCWNGNLLHEFGDSGSICCALDPSKAVVEYLRHWTIKGLYDICYTPVTFECGHPTCKIEALSTTWKYSRVGYLISRFVDLKRGRSYWRLEEVVCQNAS